MSIRTNIILLIKAKSKKRKKFNKIGKIPQTHGKMCLPSIVQTKTTSKMSGLSKHQNIFRRKIHQKKNKRKSSSPRDLPQKLIIPFNISIFTTGNCNRIKKTIKLSSLTQTTKNIIWITNRRMSKISIKSAMSQVGGVPTSFKSKTTAGILKIRTRGSTKLQEFIRHKTTIRKLINPKWILTNYKTRKKVPGREPFRKNQLKKAMIEKAIYIRKWYPKQMKAEPVATLPSSWREKSYLRKMLIRLQKMKLIGGLLRTKKNKRNLHWLFKKIAFQYQEQELKTFQILPTKITNFGIRSGSLPVQTSFIKK